MQNRTNVTHTSDASSGSDGHAYDRDVADPTESLSALPSRTARVMAFIAILIGGAAGGLIGYALAEVQSDDAGNVARGIGIFLGSTISAGGTAIVAVLVLRALGEWREIADRS